ncbi:hypothetical protein AAV35_011095 [Salimicrobium jeotgali]|nr:hypothetical protein AAV35_011095 [Salimicrobium jeotgali]
MAVSSVSGGGKTAVARALKARVSSAEILSFDNYDFPGSPSDVVQWVKEGTDYNRWNLKPLAEDLNLLIKDVHSPEYIILDYPFSYKHDVIKGYIDFSIYIDTPLDIAMARRLTRDYSVETSSEILSALRFYLEYGREAYVEMENTIKSDADLIVDGTLPIADLVNSILLELEIES